MTRKELEDRILDYLYDELEPSQRTAFERSLAAHPEIRREVEGHRATRKAFQALPRESVPVGLLDDVLAEADKEAARRRELAAVPARDLVERDSRAEIGFWEKLRRVLFQPAFAMAMVVLVVAGISLVGLERKGDLPGMPVSSDAQHIPPVAVEGASSSGLSQAGAERDEAEGYHQRSRDRLAELKKSEEEAAPANEAAAAERSAVTSDGMAAAPADTPRAKTVEATAALEDSVEARPQRRPAAKPKAGKAKDLVGGKADTWDVSKELRFDSVADGADSGGVTLSTPADGRVDGDLDDGRRGLNDPNVAGRQPLEGALGGMNDGTLDSGDVIVATEAPKAQPEPAEEPVVDAPREESGERIANKPEPAKTPAGPARDAGKVREAEEERNVDRNESTDLPDEQPPPLAPAPPPEVARKLDDDGDDLLREAPADEAEETQAERVTVTRSKRSRPTTVDDGEADKDAKPKPALTPPAPAPDDVWDTYQKQVAAGAFADAERSIEKLAKLEGESKRVRSARTELAKLIEEAAPPATDKATQMPPETPGRPPD